ncbi:MAG: hypothetical protein AAF667_20475 [Pseudomonadota bacterium]
MNVRITRKTFVYTTALFLGLVGCTAEMIVGAVPATQEEIAEMEPYLASEEALRGFLAGHTRKTYDRFHGTQIEYFDTDGRAYLWYPGNGLAVPSFWKTESHWKTAANPMGESELCFLYSRQAYNPVTREFGGLWECMKGETALYLTDEVVAGDVFNLKSSFLPYVLPEGTDVSIRAALQQSGRNVTIGENRVTWDWRN